MYSLVTIYRPVYESSLNVQIRIILHKMGCVSFLSKSEQMRITRLFGKFFFFFQTTDICLFYTNKDDTVFRMWYEKISIHHGSLRLCLDCSFCTSLVNNKTSQVVFYDQRVYESKRNDSSHGLLTCWDTWRSCIYRYRI